MKVVCTTVTSVSDGVLVLVSDGQSRSSAVDRCRYNCCISDGVFMIVSTDHRGVVL